MIINENPIKLVKHQLNNIYINVNYEDELFEEAIEKTIMRMDNCFKHINNKYYNKDSEGYFNPFHVGQWTMFLYTLANELAKYDNKNICDQLYGLNKIFSSADIFYEVEMPKIWFFDHPQGAVMGRAEYSDFFSFSQGCTVGNNKGKYPIFGKHVSMFSNSKVLGDCNIGDHVIFSANSYVLDTDIPSYSIVFGQSPNLVIKRISEEKFNELTGSMFYYE